MYSSFEQQEPASPKVSCLGQVKNMQRKKKKKNKIKPKEVAHPAQDTTPVSSAKDLKKNEWMSFDGDKIFMEENK